MSRSGGGGNARTGVMLALAGLCLLAGVASALPVVARRPGLAGALKMAAATAYILVALGTGAAGSAYGRLVLGALALSWLGDLFLLGAGRAAFLAGLGSFLLAHLIYAGAFLVRGVALVPAAGAALGMILFAGLVLRWLGGHGLSGGMRLPVALYLVALSIMVALASGAAWPFPGTPGAPGWWWGARVLTGALLFAVSDVLVARERFVRSGAVNRLAGRPLYFAAQLLLATSVA